MNNLEKEFVPYEQALVLKKLGFDEPCLGVYYESKTFYIYTKSKGVKNSDKTSQSWVFTAPTFSQAFRWFREKHNLKSCIMFRTSMEDNKEYYDWLIKGQEVVYRRFNTYEEAELECLIKLIEIVKTKP
jgi:hypothetical protein